MTTPSPLDAAPVDDLEHLFRLPDEIAAYEDLAEIHAAMVARLRAEAHGIPMSTLQQVLIERITSVYMQIRYRERAGGFLVGQQKELNTYYLALQTEFNKLLTTGQDKLRDGLMTEIQKVVSASLELISDPDNARDVRRDLAERFAAINL